jgi:outer membrane immunogenic protein
MKFAVRLSPVVVTVLAAVTTAHAADLGARTYAKAPMIDPAYNWTGFYAGVNVGYGWSKDPVNIAGTAPFDAFVGPGIDPETAANAKGFLGGVQAGYNYQINQFVLGVETDLDWSDIKKAQTDVRVGVGFAPVVFTTSGAQKLDLFGTVRGRIGWTFDRLMIFGTGGLAYGHANVSTVTGSPGGGAFTGPFCGVGGFGDCTTGSSSKMLVGAAWGAGLEWAFAGNWSTKAEYLHYDLGSVSYIAPNIYNPKNAYHINRDFDGDIVRVGLNYKFGGTATAY